MATGWGESRLNQIPLTPQASKHHHFRKRLMNNSGQKAMKMKVLSKFVKSNRKLERIPEHDSSINQSESYFASPAAFLPEASTASNSKLCSSRSCAITIIIIVSIILVSGICIGIIFGTIGSNNSTGRIGGSNTVQTTNSQNTFSTNAVVGITSSVNIGSQTGSPCSSYTTIDDPSRNRNQVMNNRPCDDGPLFNSTSGKAWIRFVGSGGTMMTMTMVKINHCGAYFGVSYNGSLPTIPGTTANGTSCSASSPISCFVSGFIEVMLCSGSPNFYIYHLRPVFICNARYCTE